MKRWHRLDPGRAMERLIRFLPTAALAACLLVLCVQGAIAAEVLLMKQDDSKIIRFDKMKRVWVTNPEVIDVVVSSYNELLVYSKSVGRTKLYVWDGTGRHEYAVQVKRLPTAPQVVRDLTNLLGRQFKYTMVDDGTVLVEGEVDTEAEKDRVSKIITAKAEGLSILDLVTVYRADLTPAEEHRRAFEKLFPGQFRYSTIDDATLVIEGEVGTSAEKLRMDKIMAAAKAITVVDLVKCLEGMESPEQLRIASIKRAVGDKYEYLELEDDILVINGLADSEAERQRIEKIIGAAAGDVTVINVVHTATDDRPANVRYAEMLRPVFGKEYSFTTIAEDGLVVEGVAPSAAEVSRIEKILDLAGDEIRVVNLVSTGAHTPGEKALAMLQESIGDKYQVRLVAQDVVVVDGAADTDADKQRVDTIIAAAPADAKVVNLVSVRVPHADSWAAARYEQALKPVLGDTLTYRILDEKTLLIEGEVATVGDRDRAKSILESLDSTITILDLIAIRPGPGAMLQSAAAKKAEAVGRIVGNSYTCTALDESTVLVQGVASSAEEQQRLAQVLEQVAGEINVVNMIVTAGVADGKTPADRTVDGLRKVVPESLKLVALDEKTVLVEGIVETSIDKERVDKIAEAAAASGQVSVLSLVLSEMQSKTPAIRRIEHLKKILGDKYNYIVWDDETVLVEGEVESQSELERVQKILAAANEDFKTGDLVTYGTGVPKTEEDQLKSDALVQRLSEAIGEPYRVWHLKGNKLVVEGIAPDAAAQARVQQLLEAFSDEAEVINLVSVAPEPVVPLAARAESLRSLLGDLFQVRTLQDKAIVVEGTVTDSDDAKRARSIIKAMGTEVSIVDLITEADPAKRQVLAHVKVLDVNHGSLKQYGINWGTLTAGSQEGTLTFGDQPFLVKVEEGVSTIGGFAANIDALKQSDSARILAEPNLVVNEGEEAEITVGGEIPIPVPQLGTGTSSITIDYKPYGVILRIKPTIMADGKTIELSVSPEVSSVDPATQVSIGGISVPAFRTRKARTVVNMPDGATLVIGGLIQRDQSRVVRGIPLLSKLPIIGSLFTSKSWQQGLSELVIMVRPEILQTTKP